MNPLEIEDIAMMADGADEYPEETQERVRAWVLSDRQFTEGMAKLEGLAAAAGLPADLKDRLRTAVEVRRDLERLKAAGEWQDPAAVLDPEETEGLDLAWLEWLAKLAEWTREDSEGAAVDVLDAILTKLHRAIDGKRADLDLVRGFVRELLKRELEHGLRLVREAHQLLLRERKAFDRGRK